MPLLFTPNVPLGLPRSGSRAGLAWLASLLLLVGTQADAAEPRDETERWVPAFGLFFDVLGQKARGSAAAGDILGAPLSLGGCLQNGDPSLDPLDPNAGPRDGNLCFSSRYPRRQPPFPREILPSSSGSDTSITPLVGGSIELMTPRLFDAWLRPRLFARGEAAAAFGFERKLAGVIAPGTFSLPVLDPLRFSNTEELSVEGQGSRARLQVRRLVLSGGLGVAFTTEFFERRVRIKPSFEYLRQEVDLIGVVNRALKLQQPAGVNDPSRFRFISLTREVQKTYHGFGPGLEIEVDTSRIGPFLMSTYFMGRGYHFAGNLDQTLTATNTDPNGCDNSGNCESATWKFELGSWAWRSGVGVRFRWLPE